MYDSHTHICTEILARDETPIMDRFLYAGGKGFLNVSYDLETIFQVIDQNERISYKYGLDARASIGLHPELFCINSDLENPILSFSETSKALGILKDQLNRHKGKFSAIGETGLDYKRILEDKTTSSEEKDEQIENQKHSFREHVRIAFEHQLPLTIHLRDTDDLDQVTQDAIGIISEEGEGLVKGVFHSYTGPTKYLQQITSLGLMVGINGIITYNSGNIVREICKELNLKDILLETDAPYLPPAEKRKLYKKGGVKYAEPADIKEIAMKVSEVKGISYERVIDSTSENFLNMFGQSS